MAINYSDPQLFHDLAIIQEAFESAAIHSGTRMGFLVAARGPLSGMEMLLDGTDQVLSSTAERKDRPTETNKGKGIGAQFDVDILELMKGGDRDRGDDDHVRGDPGDLGDWTSRYLSECLNCELRLRFDWQLTPLNLLGPLDALLDQLKLSLDGFKLRIDPFKSMEGICELLNALKGFCIPDLIMVLMSLKLLLKKYTSNVLDVHLNWTTILGPLLKLILDGISSILNNLLNIMLAPLDCTAAGLSAVNQLAKQSLTTLNALDNLFSGAVNTTTSFEPLVEDIGWNQPDQPLSNKSVGSFPKAPEFGSADTDLRLFGEEKTQEGITIPVGFDANLTTSLEDALKNPAFAHATFIEKLIVPLNEVKQYIKDLVGHITQALESLNQLCGKGLSVDLSHLGILLFITDMISLVMMIIRLLKANPGENDWCQLLQSNPNLLESALRGNANSGKSDIRVETADGDRLLLRSGPNLVGEIKTCANKRSQLDSKILKDWISDLENGKSR